MKILPVFLNTQNILITKTNNNIGPFSKNRYNTESMLAPLACDTITFSGSRRKAQNAEALRALMAYDIPDMYSGKIVIEPQILENFYSRHVFSRAIKNVIKLLIPYEKSMHTVEKEFFSIVKNMAKTEPQYKLEDVVRKIAPEHNKKLLSIQEPIFKDLIELSKKMPEDKQQDFKLLMNIIYKNLRFEPIELPFSSK